MSSSTNLFREIPDSFECDGYTGALTDIYPGFYDIGRYIPLQPTLQEAREYRYNLIVKPGIAGYVRKAIGPCFKVTRYNKEDFA